MMAERIELELKLRELADDNQPPATDRLLFPLDLVNALRDTFMNGEDGHGWEAVHGTAANYADGSDPPFNLITRAPFRRKLEGKVAIKSQEVEAALAGFLVNWHGRNQAFCFNPDARKENYKNCWQDCPAWSDNLRSVVQTLFYGGLRSELYLTETPGVSTRNLFESAAEQDAYIIFPVDFSTALDWQPDTFLSTFDAVEEFLKTDIAQCQGSDGNSHKTRIVYVAKPYHYFESNDGPACFLGEGHYRQALSAVANRLVKLNLPAHELNDRIYFVTQNNDRTTLNDTIATTLFDRNYVQFIDNERIKAIKHSLLNFERMVLNNRPPNRDRTEFRLQHIYTASAQDRADFRIWLYSIPEGHNPGQDIADRCPWFEAVAPLKSVEPNELIPRVRSSTSDILNSIVNSIGDQKSQIPSAWNIRNLSEFLGQPVENSGLSEDFMKK